MTLIEAKQIIQDSGLEVLQGGCFEDERNIYAQSVKTAPGTYGHPVMEVQFCKCGCGWLSVSGRKPVQVKEA